MKIKIGFKEANRKDDMKNDKSELKNCEKLDETTSLYRQQWAR